MKKIITPLRSKGALARAKHAEHVRQPRLAARISLGLCAMIAGLIVLAAKTDVPNVTRAPGAILPQGNYSQVETLEGGIVSAIYVIEGQLVEAGTPMVEMEQPDLQHRINALRGQRAAAIVRLENLTVLRAALLRPELASGHKVDELRHIGMNDAADQLQLHLEQQQIQRLAIDRQTETVRILDAALQFSENRAQSKSAQLESSTALLNQGIKTLNAFNAEEDQLNDLRQNANDARVDLARAKNELGRMRTDLESSRLSLREKLLGDTRATRDLIADFERELEENEARLADLSIVAPEAGIVQSVALLNLGEVIEPGQTLFELVPQRRGLVIEARIPSEDIGHIDFEQAVSIGVDTFDPRRFGKVDGQLLSLSPVPLTDDASGETYFRATIALDDTRIGQGNLRRDLRAGMTVVAEIVTGNQTMLAYFTKPVDSTLNKAFRER
ncbi:MAG: HlyD family type I secretion periplasmic adaptor subunit [Pseudomonadota bacterium]